ncbi:PhzF family phenazine biosynthesis protein [Kerstersia gyiorum]|uniref:PhzF family phenazine biosynthesis protein n=1 Tax=Kerstersia gyiorum TaxID=206506 RepID=UPI003C6D3359
MMSMISVRARRFMQIDVFSAQPYMGNPLAVVLDSDGISDAAMLRFANWTNLSETTFLLPPSTAGRAAGADYRVRIFTPGGELPFAGHPTLGSCHAWLNGGGQPQAEGLVIQECAKGLVPLRRDPANGLWAFAAPSMECSPISEPQHQAVLQAAGLSAQQVQDSAILFNGPRFWALLLDNPETVLGLTPDLPALHAQGIQLGVAARHLDTGATDLEVRVWFNSGSTLTEDPITGSFNASLAQWLIQRGHIAAPYLASQGINLGRAGQVHLSQDDSGQVWVGGQSSTCISGTVML